MPTHFCWQYVGHIISAQASLLKDLLLQETNSETSDQSEVVEPIPSLRVKSVVLTSAAYAETLNEIERPDSKLASKRYLPILHYKLIEWTLWFTWSL